MSRHLRVLEQFEERTVPAVMDLNVTYIERTPRYNYDAVKNTPAVGDLVTFSGHVRNWAAVTPAANYRWTLDGITVSSGTLTNLAEDSESVVTWQWPFQAGPHRIKLEVDSTNLITEESEVNNAVEDRTDGVPVGFWVEQSVYNYFQANQRKLGIGSNSWEDWAQRQIGLWNTANERAIYPLTPQGVSDRIRLDKVTVVPDDSLPLHGGLPSNNPDTTDKTVDLEWGFEKDILSGSFYANTTATDPTNAFYQEISLIHEMAHARYLVDNYGFDAHKNQMEILENGQPIVGTPFMPYLAFDEVLYYNQHGGIMSGPYGNTWSPHEAKSLELIAGRRATQGNMNAPGNIGAFLQDLPTRNHFAFVNEQGQPLAGADVRVYRAENTGGLYDKTFDNIPDLQFTADANGKVTLPKNPFTSDPFNYQWVSEGTAVLRISHGGQVWYRFIEMPTLNLAYWSGQTEDANYTVELRPNGSPAEITLKGFETPIANGDLTPSLSDHTDFGSVVVGKNLVRTYVINNPGELPLRLNGQPRIEVTGAGAGHFEVITQPLDNIPPRSSTSFQVRYTPFAVESNNVVMAIPTESGTFTAAMTGSGVETAINIPPVAVNDAVATRRNTAVTITVLANDSDADNDPLSVATLANLQGGSAVINGDGTVTFTPTTDFTGLAGFEYSIADPSGAKSTAQVSVTVTPGKTLTQTLHVGSDRINGKSLLTTYNPNSKTFGPVNDSLYPPTYNGGYRVASADFTGDGIEDFAYGTTISVVVIGSDSKLLMESFAFGNAYNLGYNIATGDITGDGRAELVVTADNGGGARVRIFSPETSASGGTSFRQIADFIALIGSDGVADTSFRGGGRAAVGDLNGDGYGDLFFAAGTGGGPRIAVFDGKNLGMNGGPKLCGDFFAMEPELRNGTSIAVGDFDNDGKADLFVGAALGGGPRVSILSGAGLLNNQRTRLRDFFAGDANSRGGVRLAVKDLDGDNLADLVVGDGPGAGSTVRGYRALQLLSGTVPTPLFSLEAFAGFTGGVFVG